MNQPRMALDTFLEYARTAGVLDTESNPPRIWVEGDNVNVLEIGPGDSLFTAVIAHALGASRTWIVDAASFATTDMPGYAALFELLRQTGLALRFERDPRTLPEISATM